MPSTVDLAGLDRLIARFRALGNIDPTPLLASWALIMQDDNRRGILAGQDKDGNSMAAVTYRPKGKASRPTLAQKNTANARLRKGAFTGFGPSAAGLHNNLTTAEYVKLAGPPLAPRGAFSRVITNYKTGGTEKIGEFTWAAIGIWDEVVNVKGRTFLHYHFNGEGQKVRDLRGVRPWGMTKCRNAARAFMISVVRALTPQMY